MTANQLGRVAYQANYAAMKEANDVWAWGALPTATQQHWVRVALAVAEAAETGEVSEPKEPSAMEEEHDLAGFTRSREEKHFVGRLKKHFPVDKGAGPSAAAAAESQ